MPETLLSRDTPDAVLTLESGRRVMRLSRAGGSVLGIGRVERIVKRREIAVLVRVFGLREIVVGGDRGDVHDLSGAEDRVLVNRVPRILRRRRNNLRLSRP